MIPKHTKLRKTLYNNAISHLVEAGIIDHYYAVFAKLDISKQLQISKATSIRDICIGVWFFLVALFVEPHSLMLTATNSANFLHGTIGPQKFALAKIII
jgi:hypothetical protein